MGFLELKLQTAGYRLQLREELHRLKGAGRAVQKAHFHDAMKAPSRYDDFIQMMCFVDNNKPVTLLDIGANVGDFTLDFLRYYPKTSGVHAFEPNPKPYVRLRDATSHLDVVVKCNCVALGDVGDDQTTATLYSGDDHAGGSLYIHNDASDEHFGRNSSVEPIEVAMKSLDSYGLPLGDNPVIAKIDTQGHEAEVIKGGMDTLSKCDLVLCECSFAPQFSGQAQSFSEVSTMLADVGLFPIVFQGYSRDINSYAFERDVLFAKGEILSRVYHKNG